MKIILVGGGSGGHILPLIAVQKQLDTLQPGSRYVVITDAISRDVKSQFLSSVTGFRNIKTGKFRRFAHWRWWEYFYPARFKFYLLNILDAFKILIGIVQSWAILRKESPDVIFAKGGYVSLPVGLVARFMHIPLVLHDSDTRPGIANRLIAPAAAYIASGLPTSDEKYIFTGVPVREEFYTLTQVQARKQLNLTGNKKILLITGGSLGARRINQIVAKVLQQLVEHFTVIHVSGVGDYKRLKAGTVRSADYKLYDFIGDDYPAAVLAADIVVGRAGATTIAEFAAARKPAVFIPNSFLTDQVSNAKWLESKKAGTVLDENVLSQNPAKLSKVLLDLSQNTKQCKALSHAISELARQSAARDVAELIIRAAQ